MLQQILDLAEGSSYDFRQTACPEDPLKYLFEEWVPYYRTKWAIARILQSQTILEVGVRFGYSALAFLDACPSTRYVGIDLDVNSFGGCRGAIRWARQSTRPYRADFMIADSQKMDRFPGRRYSLIHIDGQQDGEGTSHDLMLAIAQADYVLLDGYFWTRENFLSVSEFLCRYRDLVEFYGVIPGYDGELLIKTRPQNAAPGRVRVSSSIELRDVYTRDYYLLDCGGYDSFKRTMGSGLEDARLHAVTQVARTATVGRALDLGCGRGEISLSLARDGFEVTAIDYSANAIELATEAVRAAGGSSLGVDFRCSDVNSVSLAGFYDVAVASDLIEHLTTGEVDKLYRKVAEHLKADGLFVIHTCPNLWYYKYEYARKLRRVRSIGAYLPKEPRTRYELLMHINEQSPRSLRRQLNSCFEHVLLWFSCPHEPVENLTRRFSRSEMRAAPDLFAVASHSPISGDRIVAAFRMEALPVFQPNDIEVHVGTCPKQAGTNSRFRVPVVLSNNTAWDLRSAVPHPVHLCYHWLDAVTGECLVFDGERTLLHPVLRRGGLESYEMAVATPASPGVCLLRATLVQEGIRWFDAAPSGIFRDLPIRVV
jgi:SAM-dependent methyltransferase